MSTRNRDREEQQRSLPTREATDGDHENPNAAELARRARRLLDQGDETIRSALSQNSERFLSQNRQQGGQ